MAENSRGDYCCTCGRPRGLAQRRRSWGLECPTVIVPRTGNPADRPCQITNDLIYNASVWRNGGSDESTHLCDDCIRIGLRKIKLKVDELLEEIEAGADKDAEIALLTQRLGKLQFSHQSLVYEHNRMQERLATVLKLVPESENKQHTEVLKVAKWEVDRGPEENEWGTPANGRFDLREEERQAILLAIAKLSLSRPGWHPACLSPIADKLQGHEMYEEFRRHGPDNPNARPFGEAFGIGGT